MPRARIALLHLAALAASIAPATAQQAPRWSYCDSRETPTGPRLVLELEGGELRELDATEDTLLLSYLADRFFGAHPQLALDLADTNRALVRFDVPPELAISVARVVLTTHPSPNLPPTEPFDVALHRVDAPWSESATTWSNQPAFELERAALASLQPEGGELAFDVTDLARAWSSATTANHGILLRIAEPRASTPQPATGEEGSAIDRELLESLEWAPTLEAGLERARTEDKRVLVLLAGAFGQEHLAEHERLLLATVLCHPDVQTWIERDLVPVRLRVSPAMVALAAEGAEISHPLESLGLELTDVRPPALLLIDGDGKVLARQVGFAVCDSESMLERLGGGAARPSKPADLREALSRMRSGRFDEARAAFAELEEVPEALYWSAALCAARGDATACRKGLDRIESEHADSAWALKARARRAYPELVSGYEALSTPKRPSSRADLERGAVRYLRAAQLPDGSFPMGHPPYEEHREGITVLAALALLVHGDAEGSQRAFDHLAPMLAARRATDVNSFTATYWLDLCLERRAREVGSEEQVASAIALLLGGQMENGAWSYSRTFGDGWRGGFGGWPPTDLGRAHSMNTAIALEVLTRARKAGYDVDAQALERGRDALLAMRAEPAAYTYTWPDPRVYATVDASIARAPAAELALVRLGAAADDDLDTALREFLARRSTLHPPAQLSDAWLPPHALSGYFHSFAYYHAARALAERGGSVSRSGLAALRADVLARAEDDGTWMDTIGLGKPYATAMALLVLELSGE
jgi:hypothetical protein